MLIRITHYVALFVYFLSFQTSKQFIQQIHMQMILLVCGTGI